eukprot:TRINITY_DN9807_c0_g1_i1.p1 TRINITY_DN9807_c0_g1~~TRINITY_DN9807_c0_g1_i1.p1  ORF type:complete len:866 (-),score=178.01 TRINITY_DN9807_c0_g1_i1:61-2421(-)
MEVDDDTHDDVENERFFSVMFGNRQSSRRTPQTQAEQEEGLLIVSSQKCSLLNMECKSVGRATPKNVLKFLDRNLPIIIGNREVQIQEEVSGTAFTSGQFFLRRVSEKEVNKPPPEKVVYTLAAARNRFARGRFTCPLKIALEVRDPSQPLHSPYVEGAVILYRAKPGERNSQGEMMVSVVVDPVLGVHLRPHQRRGVKFMFDCLLDLNNIRGNGAILADDMGLGKSLQAIAIMWTLLRQGIHGVQCAKKAAIVCPSSLVGNWAKEFQKWLGDRVNVKAITHVGKTAGDVVDFYQGRYDVLVISYEQFMRNVDVLKRGSLDLIVCDEGHRLKNGEIKTTKSLASMPTQKRIILSGTPIQNDLEEFFCMCDFVNHGVLGSYTSFKRVFETPILLAREPGATDEEKALGEARSRELTRLTSQFILRRTSVILTKYLPPKFEYVVFCGLSDLQRQLYKKFARSSAAKQVANGEASTAASLGCITALKKLCNHPKLVYDMWKEGGATIPDSVGQCFPADFAKTGFEAEHSGKALVMMGILKEMRAAGRDKIVVVSNYTQTLDLLATMCKRRNYGYLRLDGSTPLPQRQKLVDQFNDPAVPEFVFFLSSKAGGCGLNLVGANRLVLYDPDWNPASDLQAMARVWRDGQKKNVFIYRMLSTGSIEEKIYQRQISKTGLASSVLSVDEEAPQTDSGSSFSTEDLRDIFTLNETTVCSTHDLINCRCKMQGLASSATMACQGDEAASKVAQLLSTYHHYADVTQVADATLANAYPEAVSFVFSLLTDGALVPTS